MACSGKWSILGIGLGIGVIGMAVWMVERGYKGSSSPAASAEGVTAATVATLRAVMEPEAEAILKDLSIKMADKSWADEADFFERTDVTGNRISSGEAAAYLRSTKDRLAQLGIQVRWNAQAKHYDVIDKRAAQ